MKSQHGWVLVCVVVGKPLLPARPFHFQHISTVNGLPRDKLPVACAVPFAARLQGQDFPSQRGAIMSLTPEEIDEINLLAQYNLANTHEGLKIHQRQADANTIAAAERLYQRGLTTMDDGGYLTSLGLDAAEHAQHLLTILRAR